jgi:hypothetical protein
MTSTQVTTQERAWSITPSDCIISNMPENPATRAKTLANTLYTWPTLLPHSTAHP